MHYKEQRLIVQKVRMTTDLETVKALSLFNNFQTVYFQRNNLKKKVVCVPMESNISNIYTASLFNNLYLYRTLR